MGRVRYIGEHSTSKEIEHSESSDWIKEQPAACDRDSTWLTKGIRWLSSTDDQDSEIFNDRL